ncbi:MAG: hypothetical protein VKL59_25700 [Nostocaceae cyanobacterium]|nr:hypothetical protein [Nostocaceae cyanobacterium]
MLHTYMVDSNYNDIPTNSRNQKLILGLNSLLTLNNEVPQVMTSYLNDNG